MQISVVGQESTRKLRKLVEDFFSNLERGELRNRLNPPVPFLHNYLNLSVKVASMESNNVMELQFFLPSQRLNELSKPLDYIELLLLRKTDGTFVSTLLSKHWVTEVEINPKKQFDYENFHLLTITFHLTDEGLSKTKDITAFLFKYLELIKTKGINDIYYWEHKFYAHRYFAFPAHKVKGPTDELYFVNDSELPAKDLSIAMAEALRSNCTINLAWKCTRDVRSFDKKAIEHLLNHFTLNNLRQVILSKQFNDSELLNKTKDDVKFSTSPLEISTIEEVNLKLPTENKYFPKMYYDEVPLSYKEKNYSIFKTEGGVVWRFNDSSQNDLVIRFMLAPDNPTITKKSEAYLSTIVQYFKALVSPMNELVSIADGRIIVEVGARGDLNDEELKEILELIRPTSELQPTIAPYPKPIKLTNGTYYQKMKAWDSDIKSTGLLFYLETYKYTDKRSLFLSHIIQHLLSTEIKPTLENLGIVYIGVQPVVFQGGIMILIEGKRTPVDLEKEVEKFLDTVKTKIELPDVEFKAKLDDLKLKHKPAEPHQILENYWKSIENRFFDFGWETDLIKFIDSVNRTQVLDFYNAKIKKSSQRIKFSAHLTPKNFCSPKTNMTKETEFGELITDRFEWRERQNSWNYPEGFYPRAYDGPFKSEGP
ncbi:hypothetical protein L0F63_004333 [Massospora cicadina]|nr:hypothetical protein L0F63_004333 [Massospora cicadina]